MSNRTFRQIVEATRDAMAEFALARIAEEEAAAAAAYDALHDAEAGGTAWAAGAYEHNVMTPSPYADFIRSRSPEQALRQCQVYRSLVTLSVQADFIQTLRLILLTWMDHPDYREEWKP